jgi:two-component system, NarL family, response regulator DesR
MTIKIILIEDQKMILDAFKLLLSAQSDFVVVEVFTDAKIALTWLVKNSIDIVISDVELPAFSGLDMAEEVKKMNAELKIIMLTTFAKIGYLERAIKIGVNGYLTKDMPIKKLIQNIRKVNEGNTVISKDLRTGQSLNPNPLSCREKEILKLISFGLSNKDISIELNLSNGTVRNNLSVAMDKLNVNNRIEAIKLAFDNGWI